jgi:hypothetical protein
MSVRWSAVRPRVLVVACSDGRLQEITDEFLRRKCAITHYDRLYVPGGAGALSASGRDFMRAQQLQQECKYLVHLHGVEHVIALFHAPAVDGPAEAVCADYRRKFEWATPAEIRAQQEEDARELLRYRDEWAARAAVSIYRGEVNAAGDLAFVQLHADPDRTVRMQS